MFVCVSICICCAQKLRNAVQYIQLSQLFAWLFSFFCSYLCTVLLVSAKWLAGSFAQIKRLVGKIVSTITYSVLNGILDPATTTSWFKSIRFSSMYGGAIKKFSAWLSSVQNKIKIVFASYSSKAQNTTCTIWLLGYKYFVHFSSHRLKGKKGRALDIAPQVDTATTEALRYMARTKQRRTYLPYTFPGIAGTHLPTPRGWRVE